jgi:hypothetical protein
MPGGKFCGSSVWINGSMYCIGREGNVLNEDRMVAETWDISLDSQPQKAYDYFSGLELCI